MFFKEEEGHSKGTMVEGAMVAEKGNRERSTQGNVQKECFHIGIGLENERG